MPLPDATPPENARIYEELKSKTALLGASTAVTPDLLDNLLNQLFLDYQNEDELRRHLLVAMVTSARSFSGPIPNSMFMDVVAFGSSGSAVVGFQPGVGEVYQLTGNLATSASGVSGTVFIEQKLREKSTSKTAEILSSSTTSGTLVPHTETNQGPIFIDENFEILYEATGTYTSGEFVQPIIRVR